MTGLMRRSLATMAVAVAALAGIAPAAHASTRSKIIADCSDDGVLQGRYTASQLRDARKHLPSDVAEYTDCPDVLRRAELNIGGPGGSGGTSTGTGTGGGATAPGGGPPSSGGAAIPAAPATPQTPSDQAALDAAAQAAGQPVTVSGRPLLAGSEPLRRGYRANGLPTSLVIALILLALAGVALSVPPVRRRFPQLRLPW